MRTLRLNDTEYAFCDELGMETVDVRELKLQGCMGCGACERRIHHGGECAVADDMQMLYPKIAQCEKLVFICRSRAFTGRKQLLDPIISKRCLCAVLKASAARKTKKEVENRWTFVYNRKVKCVRKEGVPQIFR